MSPSAASSSPRRLALWLALLLSIPVLLLAIHRLIVVPIDYTNKDFMSLWSGGRAVLLGLNPYDEAVWRDLRAANGSTWFPDPRAPFPLWTFLLTAPLALLPVPVAASLWLGLSAGFLALSAFWLLRGHLGERPSLATAGILILGVFFSRPALMVPNLGQMTFLLLLILVGYVKLLEVDRPFLAGACLALTALKPNAFIAFLPLVGLWLLWRRQTRVIAGGAAAGLAMLGLTWLVEPGWLWQWLGVAEKTSVANLTPTLWGLAGAVGGASWIMLGALLVIVLTTAVGVAIFRRPWLPAWLVTSLALCLSLLVTPYTWSYEHALLLLPWLAWFIHSPLRRGRAWGWIALSFVLPWVAFAVAIFRDNDACGWMVPAATLVALFTLVPDLARRRDLAQAETVR